jgi:hypothetical protein
MTRPGACSDRLSAASVGVHRSGMSTDALPVFRSLLMSVRWAHLVRRLRLPLRLLVVNCGGDSSGHYYVEAIGYSLRRRGPFRVR